MGAFPWPTNQQQLVLLHIAAVEVKAGFKLATLGSGACQRARLPSLQLCDEITKPVAREPQKPSSLPKEQTTFEAPHTRRDQNVKWKRPFPQTWIMIFAYPGSLELSPLLPSPFRAAPISLPHTRNLETSLCSLFLSLWFSTLDTTNTRAVAIHWAPTMCQGLYQLAGVPDCKQQKHILTNSGNREFTGRWLQIGIID